MTLDSETKAQPRVVVLGVGNTLMADEGVGVRCVDELEREGRLPAGVRAVDGGTSTHELLEDLENLDLLIILDAVASGRPPGTILRLEGAEIPSAFSNKLSPHQHGINDLLATLTLLGRSPKRVVLVGVEPERLSLSLDLSPLVASRLPEMKELVLRELSPIER
jgi:hydrogenase maturation protease